MKEIIIAAGNDLNDYILSRNNIYSCRITGGVALRKNGVVIFKDLKFDKIFITIQKISGNGKFNIMLYNGVIEERVVANIDKIILNNYGGVRINRSADSIGDIAITTIGYMLDDTMHDMLSNLKFCNYSGIRVVGNDIIASTNAYIDGFIDLLEITTKPANCFVVGDKRITFPVQCFITNFKVNCDKAIDCSAIIKKSLEIENIKVKDAINFSDFNSKVIYDSNKTKFVDAKRRFGNFTLLNNKNNKIMLLSAGSEIKIPVTLNDGQYYCVEILTRCVSRLSSNFYIGFEDKVLMKKDFVSGKALTSNKFYIKTEGNRVGNVLIGIDRKSTDSIYIDTLNVATVLKEGDSNSEKLFVYETDMQEVNKTLRNKKLRNVDLSQFMDITRMSVPNDVKLKSIKTEAKEVIRFDVNNIEYFKVIAEKDFVLCVGSLNWLQDDYDLFISLLDSYGISIIVALEYTANKEAFMYLLSKGKVVICTSDNINAVKDLVTQQNNNPNILIVDESKPFDSVIDLVLCSMNKEEKIETVESIIEDSIELFTPIVSKREENGIRFKVVVPSYNSVKWIDKTLSSIASQTYNNFDVCIVDDLSPDEEQRDIIRSYCEKYDSEVSEWKYIFNKQRMFALYNIVNAIKNLSCNDNDVIVTVDGDDWLYDENVFSKLEKVYRDKNIYMTYGQYINYPSNKIGHCHEYSKNIKDRRAYRHSDWAMSHLRTFKYILFKNINERDFLDTDGKYYKMAWDLVLMFPMAEMCDGKFKFISEPLYVYNGDNPLNDHKIDLRKQVSTAAAVRRKQMYKPLAL